MNSKEFQELLAAIDKSLALFDGESSPGFDREVHEELRRVRETLIRAQRDQRDKNVTRDSRSPFATS